MITFLLLYLFLFPLAQSIKAQATTPIFRDDFERSELGEWQVVRNQQYGHPEKPCMNGANEASWEIKEGKMGIEIDSIACTTEIVPKNFNLKNTPNYKIKFEWFFADSISMDRNFLIKWFDENNWLGLHILNNKIILQKVVDGKAASLYENFGEYPFLPNQNYEFTIKVSESQFKIYINQELIISTHDRIPFFSKQLGSPTFGFQASSGSIFASNTWFDNLEVSSLNLPDEKRLHLQPFLQTDPHWKNRTYDQADEWSHENPPTIERWGCALSSAAMVLNFYGINQLPNGQSLTPARLNLWLNSQSDGYLGEGLLNWMAISRLTKEMNPILDTPILEYEYQKFENKESNFTTAQKLINQGQPIIINVPGHFVVADGYASDELYIKDPLGEKQVLSEYVTPENPDPWLSSRIFTPSHTDLSYLLIVHKPGVEIALLDKDQNPLLESEIYNQFLQAALPENLSEENSGIKESPEQTQPSIIHTLAKPNNGVYYLRVIKETNSEFNPEIKIYAYNQAGEVALYQPELEKDNFYLLKIDFNKDDENNFALELDFWTQFKSYLNFLYYSRKIPVRYVYRKLSQVIAWTEKTATLKEKDRYFALLKATISELEKYSPGVIIEFLKRKGGLNP